MYLFLYEHYLKVILNEFTSIPKYDLIKKTCDFIKHIIFETLEVIKIENLLFVSMTNFLILGKRENDFYIPI